MGEDIGRLGGVFRVTEGLQAEFGESRVLDTPLAESGIVGTAIGLAMRGYRPVCEIQFDGFIYPGFDQITSQLAKLTYRHEGTQDFPVVIRVPYGGHIGAVEHHQESPEAYFAHTPGLRVVSPATANDGYWMMRQAIESRDPVLFFEPKRLYRASTGEVPESDYQLPLGEAEVIKEGSDITLLAWGAQMEVIEEAAELAEKEGISCEVIDLRSILPWDVETVANSVLKTGRLLISHEAPLTGGFAGEIAATIQERCFLYLESPISRVTGLDTPFPLTLEKEYLPDRLKVFEAIKASVAY